MTEMLINGQPQDNLPADDRGLLYGDHLFETMAFHDGIAPLWERHWRRLTRDSARLALTPPPEKQLLAECRQLATGQRSCTIRVTLTRGSGGRAYRPPSQPECRRIVQRRPWPADLARQQADGLRLMTSPIRLACHSTLAGMKHGNRLEQVLAAKACAEAGYDEALVFDADGRLVEAISSNVIIVIGDQARTPQIGGAGVSGVGLDWLCDQPETNIEPSIMTSEDLVQAEAIMVINSVAGIRPATSIDERPLEAGSHCRHWQRLWAKRLNE